MSYKKQLTLKQYKNPQIRKGNRVMLIDGSGLSSPKAENLYIVCAYPKLTGNNVKLQDLVFTVTKTDVEDKAVSGTLDTVYKQDIEITFNRVVFYTCSEFVRAV